MVYNYRNEYTDKVCEGKAKVEQEIVVVKKIMELLNQNKYDNLDDFISRNQNLQDFLKNNHMETAIKHFNTFGNPLNEEDYVKIIGKLKEITAKKQNADTNEIETTDIRNKQYNSMEIDGQQHYVETSGGKTIEERMKDIQQESEEFQTSNEKQNTENMFKEIENKQDSINPIPLNEIDPNTLNDVEKETLSMAFMYQHDTGEIIKLDIKKEIMVNENNEIMRIIKENGETKIVSNENGKEKETTMKEKTYQKQLTPATDTLHSA